MSRLIARHEVFSEAHLTDENRNDVVRIPSCETCKQMPWDCCCKHKCESCGQVGEGPALCGDCYGGY